MVLNSNNVETRINYLNSVKAVLEKEANEILKLKENVGESMVSAIEMILACKGRIVITGVGKSGIIGRKLNATLASTGTPSLFLHPTEGLHGDLGMVTKNDVVIAISNSGESEEVLRIIPSLKKIGVKMIAISKNPSSSLAKKADIVLSLGDVEEAGPLGLAPTSSTTVTLALGDAIAIALIEARGFGADDFAVFHPAGSLGRKLLLTVKDIVETTHTNPIVQENSTVQDALFQMTAHGIGGVSIVNKIGEMVGILTDGDIRRALANEERVYDKPVKELLSSDPITIQIDALAKEAVQKMENLKVNVLPVVDKNNHPIAMIQIRDLMGLGI